MHGLTIIRNSMQVFQLLAQIERLMQYYRIWKTRSQCLDNDYTVSNTAIWLKVGLTHIHTQKKFNSTNTSEGQKLTTVFQTADDTLIIIAKGLLSTINCIHFIQFHNQNQQLCRTNTSSFSKKQHGKEIEKNYVKI